MTSPMVNQDEAEKIFTVQEFLEHQQNLQQEAKQAFPFRFDECSYSQGKNYFNFKDSIGYTNQRAYVCKTCITTEPTLICYSCSIACHGDHEIVELWFKRNVRCDCCTPAIKGKKHPNKFHNSKSKVYLE